MANPWLKKNPFMSMWLSAANRAVGTVRAQVSGQAKRQVNAAIAQAVTPKVLKAKPRRKP
jgi:hypothetical protein